MTHKYQTPSEGITSSINVTSLNPSSRRENKYLMDNFPLGRGTKGDDSEEYQTIIPPLRLR
jgi:hypothetical protein